MYNSKKTTTITTQSKEITYDIIKYKTKNIFLKINFGHIYIVTILNNLTLFIRII